MKNNCVAFQVLNNDQAILPGHTFLEWYMIFDVKMEFTRKACFVANGAKTPNPKESTYAGVVSIESFPIPFTYSDLMGFDNMAT